MRSVPQRLPLLLLLATLLLSFDPTVSTKDTPDDDFFLLCSGGDHKKLTSLLKKHPDWAHAKTQDSEHCLHLAGIQGYAKVTKLFLEKGADPDVRSNANQGLRMTPLSWNVYGNHYENCKLLLEGGADVNLDFDHDKREKGKDPVRVKITAMDLLQFFSSGTDAFEELEALLLKYGAKTYKELQKEKEL